MINKAKQVNKIVVKKKIAAPVSVETYAKDVYISYSPAIVKEAVNEVIEEMNEDVTFETDKMHIKVFKCMPLLT